MSDATHRQWTDRFSDYLAGDMAERERADLEEHLAACAPCRDVLAELRAIVSAAAELPDVEPPHELWPGIHTSIRELGPRAAPGAAKYVIALPTARRPGPPRDLRHLPGLGRARLAAAAAALVAVSVGATWWIATSRQQPLADTVAEPPTEVVSAASDAVAPPPSLADDLAALEGVLDSARDVLDPATVLVLERNLDVIERAIADSRRALELEPGNEFLTEHLERMYRRKLLYLQDVVRVVGWAG